MARVSQEWAKGRDEQVYHYVTFRPGPRIHEETAACGKTDRFWPRIGIRMEDRQCLKCIEACVAAAPSSIPWRSDE